MKLLTAKRPPGLALSINQLIANVNYMTSKGQLCDSRSPWGHRSHTPTCHLTEVTCVAARCVCHVIKGVTSRSV